MPEEPAPPAADVAAGPAAAPPVAVMDAVVPPGMGEGMTMQVQTPNGLMNLQIPTGAKEGTKFQFPEPTKDEVAAAAARAAAAAAAAEELEHENKRGLHSHDPKVIALPRMYVLHLPCEEAFQLGQPFLGSHTHLHTHSAASSPHPWPTPPQAHMRQIALWAKINKRCGGIGCEGVLVLVLILVLWW